MMLDFLQALLSPYEQAKTGQEIDLSLDPIYSTLMPDKPMGQGPRAASGMATGAPGSIQEMVRQMAAKRGWGGAQWKALQELIMRESGFNPRADNPTSSAYGLFQFLDSTRANYGLPLHAGPRKQTRAGLGYIADRYGNPANAWDFWQRNHYY